ncbi:glycosyl hydrolase family 18 protein [Natrarchaeobius chitinivorans]|uniref:PKD domain-containing protein n=1 Tax=Natrarchaeobius chitinivorans TaxID=1679083 RepID=A0A3N6LZZ4_NATCH|nr:glycosyl hydrolase family 18 protein [Natrarchaeobius chitinivorans]RQG93554.1 PKD domain-containing protein [Natrarchaeobius chitinivorans]
MKRTRRNVLGTASTVTALLFGASVSSAEQEHPEWDPDDVYTSGDRVVYDGSVWEAQWWTQGEEPETGPGPWEQVDEDDGNGNDDDGENDDGDYPAWDPDAVYTGGDRVVHDGSVWEANWWTQGDEPGESQWGPWEEIEEHDPGLEAAIDVRPGRPDPGEELTVDGSGSSGEIDRYEWDLGDGTEADGEIVTHSYDEEGEYTIELTLVGADGDRDSTETILTVADGDDGGWPGEDHPVMAYEFSGPAPAEKVTHVIQTFGDVAADGSVSVPWDVGGVDGAVTLLSIGGWGNSDGFPQTAADAESRERFASDCVDLMREHDIDGIDIDWEYPGPFGPDGLVSYDDDPENFTALLSECRQQFDEAATEDDTEYYLTAALSAHEEHLEILEHEELADVLDFAKMMTYDMHSPGLEWVEYTNHNAPLYSNPESPTDKSVHDTMTYMQEQGWPEHKLVLGLAFYGREYSGVESAENDGLFQPFSSAGAVPSYPEIQDGFDDYDRLWDDEAKVPWRFDGENLLGYDDEESIAIKAEYASEHGYPLMYWASGHDPNETLVDAVNDALDK